MGVGGQRHVPVALAPGKCPGYQCTGGWMGLRDGLDRYDEKIFCPLPGFEPWAVQPVVSSCTEYASPLPPLDIQGIVSKD
jgi:hypothetical protein